jgi:hypothetical protein
MENEFKTTGTYIVRLGLVYKNEESVGPKKVCVMKEIIIE